MEKSMSEKEYKILRKLIQRYGKVRAMKMKKTIDELTEKRKK